MKTVQLEATDNSLHIAFFLKDEEFDDFLEFLRGRQTKTHCYEAENIIITLKTPRETIYVMEEICQT